MRSVSLTFCLRRSVCFCLVQVQSVAEQAIMGMNASMMSLGQRQHGLLPSGSPPQTGMVGPNAPPQHATMHGVVPPVAAAAGQPAMLQVSSRQPTA